jgi:hypothetical protein
MTRLQLVGQIVHLELQALTFGFRYRETRHSRIVIQG